MRKAVKRYFQVGRDPVFRRFWLGMMISRAGDAFTTVALSWVVLTLAGPVQLGLVLACFSLPRVVSGPVVGHVLDRWDPRLLLAGDNAARGLLMASVPVLLWLHHLAVADLYVIAAACALLSAVTEVAEVALVPRMVGDEHLEAANSMLAANWEAAAIAGPAVSGVIIATAGAAFALLLDAASFAVMSVICLKLPRPGAAGTPAAPSGRPAAAPGRQLGLMLRSPALLVLTACSVGMLALDGAATVVYPVYCRTFLHVSAVGYGVLVSAAGVGALLGVVCGAGVSGRLPLRLRIAAVIFCGAPFFGLLRLAPNLPVAAGLLGLASFCWGPYFALDRTLTQRLVPGEVRAKLAGVRMTISSAGFPLGTAIGGALIGAAGLRTTIPAIAAAYLALAALPLLSSGLRAYPAGRTGQNAKWSGPVQTAAPDLDGTDLDGGRNGSGRL